MINKFLPRAALHGAQGGHSGLSVVRTGDLTYLDLHGRYTSSKKAMTMASITTNITTRITTSRNTVPLADRLVRGLERLAQFSPTYRKVDALGALDDAELAEQGTTRQEAAARIFGNRLYL